MIRTPPPPLDHRHAAGMKEASPAARRVGRPRRGEVDQLDDQVLMVARQCFIERGFAYTTITDVALKSGTTRRSVMHRYPDKNALLLAVAERSVTEAVGDILVLTAEDEPPLERLRAVSRELLALATDPAQIALYRVYLGELARLPDLSTLLIRNNDEMAAGIERIVLKAQAIGRFQRYSAAAVATGAISMMLSNPINRALMGDPQFHDTHRIDLYFSQMWAIFLLMV